VSREETVAQLRLFPLHAPPRSPHGRPRVVSTHTAEQRAAFRRTEEVIAEIRPESVGGDRKLCAGCGRIIHRERRNCGRRWCPLVNGIWSRDREAVIRRALEAHGGPFLVIAITQGHREGWWDCDEKGASRSPLLWHPRLQGRVARYLSKYPSKEAAGDWLRAKAGQRVFYVAPWLGRAAGASMRLARLARIVWAASRGYVPMPRIEDEDREALAAFIRGPTAARAP